MTYCLNPDCKQPQNADDVEFCQTCGARLTPLLRGRYRVVQPIGQGGFGKTLLALDEDRLNSRCVIKQFSPQVQGTKSLEKAIQLFEQEAVRLHELGEHPQIPTLLAYFEHEQRLYLVQQFIEGPTLLQELIQQGPFSEYRIRELLAGVLPILKFVHDHQVIHRDITPANIIRRKSDNRLVLIDFGVAKLLSTETSAQPGTKIGTEGYAPIEQLRSGKAYPASDLYSLAATCVFLMTQTRPEDLYDPLRGQWMWREKLQQRGGKVSDAIGHILDTMLKDLVSERYSSADAVMRDLRRALSQPTAQVAGVGAASTTPSKPISPPPAPPLSNPPAAQKAISLSNPPAPVAAGSPSKPPVSGGDRRCLYSLTGHSRWVMAVAISLDGRLLASGGLDDLIKVWDLETGELLRTLTGHRRAVNCLAISPNGQFLLSGSDDHTIRIWSLTTGDCLRSLVGHTRDVNSLAIHTSGTLFASGSEDRTVRVWNLASTDPLQTFSNLAGMVQSVAISPDAQTIASGGSDNQIKLWSMKQPGQSRSLAKVHFNWINALAYTPNGANLISASRDKTLKIWDVTSGEAVRTLSGHTDAVTAIALTADGNHLLSGSSDKTLKLWNLKTGSLLCTLSDHLNSVNAVALSANGQIAASASSDNTVKVWQLGI
jgi:WD40 repeat protein